MNATTQGPEGQDRPMSFHDGLQIFVKQSLAAGISPAEVIASLNLTSHCVCQNVYEQSRPIVTPGRFPGNGGRR